MDYAVGSLSDLITGSNTPNKPKVVTRNVQVQTVAPIEEPQVPWPFRKVQRPVMEFQRPVMEFQRPVKKFQRPVKEIFTSEIIRRNLDQDEEEGGSHEEPEEEGGSHEEPEGDEESSAGPKLEVSQTQVNAQRRLAKKGNPGQFVRDPEITARTLFIGNLPCNLERKQVLQRFKKYGHIENVRIRGVAPMNPKINKKIAFITKQLHPKSNSVLCYVKFKKREACLKALVENGQIFNGHHLRVSTCDQRGNPDESKAIFVGNLSFDAQEDELWELFKECGLISYVRIIRDPKTMMGKGFAYVNFVDSDSVQLAIAMDNVKLRDRVLRITLCNSNVASKYKNYRKQITKSKKMRWRNMNKKVGNDNNVNGNMVKVPKEEHQDMEKRKRSNELTVEQTELNQDSQVVDKKKKFKKMDNDVHDGVQQIKGPQLAEKKKFKKMDNRDANKVPKQHIKQYQGPQFAEKKKFKKMDNGDTNKVPKQHIKQYRGPQFAEKKMKFKKVDNGDANIVPKQHIKEYQGPQFAEKKMKFKKMNNGDANKVPKQHIKQYQGPQFAEKKMKFKKMNNSDANKVPKQHIKEYQGSQFAEKKKKRKVNKGLLEKKKKISGIAPK